MKLRLDHPRWQQLAPMAARGLVRVIFGTSRSRLIGDPEGLELAVSGAPVIFTVWHGHLLAPLFLARAYRPRGRPIVLMASPSRDGQFIAEVARGLGFITVPGSRHKGGVQALKAMAVWLREGHAAGLAADGSRGPRHVVQKGVLYLARETRLPIVPLAVAASRKVTLNTWDGFEIPLPLSRSAILVGSPLTVGSKERGPALEARRLELEERLKLLFSESQRYFHR